MVEHQGQMSPELYSSPDEPGRRSHAGVGSAGGHRRRNRLVGHLALATCVLTYILLFAVFYDRSNRNLDEFVLLWFGELVKGGFGAVAGDFYNYSPPYLYLLSAGTVLSGYF